MQLYNLLPLEEEKSRISKSLKKCYGSEWNVFFTDKGPSDLRYSESGLYVTQGKIYKTTGISKPFDVNIIGFVTLPNSVDVAFSIENIPDKYVAFVIKLNAILDGFDNPEFLSKKDPKKIQKKLMYIFCDGGSGLLKISYFREKLANILNVIDSTLSKCEPSFENCFRKKVNIDNFKLLLSKSETDPIRSIQKFS